MKMQNSEDTDLRKVQTKESEDKTWSWNILIGKTDAKAKAPIVWPHDGGADSLEKTLMLGKIKGKRRRGRQRKGFLDSITNSMDMNLTKLRETVKDKGAWHDAVHGVTKSWI